MVVCGITVRHLTDSDCILRRSGQCAPHKSSVASRRLQQLGETSGDGGAARFYSTPSETRFGFGILDCCWVRCGWDTRSGLTASYSGGAASQRFFGYVPPPYRGVSPLPLLLGHGFALCGTAPGASGRRLMRPYCISGSGRLWRAARHSSPVREASGLVMTPVGSGEGASAAATSGGWRVGVPVSRLSGALACPGIRPTLGAAMRVCRVLSVRDACG